MDLGAYAQIPDLDKVLQDNNIDIPRLRGLRLMKNEEPITRKEMDEIAIDHGLYKAPCLVFSIL